MRQRRRTALALAAVAFGVCALMLAGGFIGWNLWALRESTIHSQLGHAQTVRAGYFERGAADPHAFLLPAQSPALDAIAAMHGVRTVAPRLSFTGLASRNDTTLSFLGEGVVPELETELSRDVTLAQGEGLSSTDPEGIVLGKGLAAGLGAKPGDTIVLLTKTVNGGVAGLEARVRGTYFTSNKAYDDASLRVTLATARKLLQTDGAHRWVVLLDRTERTAKFMRDLGAALPPGADGLETVPWYQLAQYVAKVEALFSAQLDLLRTIIAVIILASISNILVMSALERTSEIGTMMAVGTRSRRVLALFLAEGVILGALGSALGALVGAVLAVVISHVGIPMPPAPGTDFSYRGEIRLTWELVASTTALTWLATVAAALYPAWRASRLNIVDALRHSR